MYPQKQIEYEIHTRLHEAERLAAYSAKRYTPGEILKELHLTAPRKPAGLLSDLE